MLLINVLQVLRLRRLLRCLPRLALLNSALVRLARAAPLVQLGAYLAQTIQKKTYYDLTFRAGICLRRALWGARSHDTVLTRS